MLLNDFRWTPEINPRFESLNLLEGQTVHFTAPKTHFDQEIILSDGRPSFGTGIEMLQLAGKCNHVQKENKIMTARWKKIKFGAPIPI